MTKPMQLVHLNREVKTALELAIAGAAPESLIDRLAVAAGLMEAFTDLGLTEPTPLITRTVERATEALAAWRSWHHDRPPASA